MGRIVYRSAVGADEDGILALATEALGWGSDDRFRRLFRWKHDENSFGPSPRWVAVDEGRIVGFRTLMRWRFVHHSLGVKTAVRAVDTATAPSHRGRGIFRGLTMAAIEELQAEGIDFVFNTPNDQSRPGYLKMGWVELGRPRVGVVPRLRSLGKIARSRTAADRWSLDADLGRDARGFFREADERWSDLWTNAGDGWQVERSLDWCRWRYGLADLRYRVLTTEDVGIAGPDGAIVFRLRRRGPSVEATVVQVAARGAARRALLRRLLGVADYVLVAMTERLDATPAVAVGAFSPLVTWRDLAHSGPIPLDRFRFGLADLELF